MCAVFTALTTRGWLILLTDGVLAGAVMVAAIGWGAWPVVWLGLGKRPGPQQVCLAAALGLGVLAVSTLVLGMGGVLNRPVAFGLVIGGMAVGLGRLHATQRGRSGRRPAARGPDWGVAALLLLAVPVAVMLFGAVLPPGVLWADEAKGFDALEYHLQGPREYFEAGRITFLPHNVYTSFPQQMEMLYLLLMHLAGGPYAAALAIQLLHACCGVLAVVVLGVWTPAGWGRRVVWLVAGTVPWVAYLGCLAYVECGMLLFASVAAGLIADHCRNEADCDWRLALAAGLCAGLAGGCKYTAIVFAGVALGVAWLIAMRGGVRRRARLGAVYAVGAVAAISPWLIRNAAFTGNPVYPFAYEWFGGKAWSSEQAAQWERGHRVRAAHDSIGGRATLAWRDLFGSRFFGPGLFVLAAGGLALGRSRVGLLCALWAGIVVVLWAGLTHMPGRFAVPVIVPLALLAGEAFGRPGVKRPVLVALALAAVAGAAWNAGTLVGLLGAERRAWGKLGIPLRSLVGATDAFRQYNRVNQVTPPDANVWLVGEARAFYIDRRVHYTVVFNRDLWVEYARGGASPGECVAWLRSRDVTHVVFSWAEIGRLRRTYGFSEQVTPEWVEQLAAAGLKRIRAERTPSGELVREVFEVAAE